MLATACHTGSNHDRRTGLYRACKISKLLAVASSACMLQEKYERETRKGKAGRKKIESIAYQCLHFSERLLDFFLCWEVAPPPLSRATKKNLMLRCTSHILWCISIYLPLYLSCPCLPACVRVYGQACMYDNNGSEDSATTDVCQGGKVLVTWRGWGMRNFSHLYCHIIGWHD